MATQDASVDTPSHLPGARKGEDRAKPLPERMTRKANDASGINLEDRGPIDSRMPDLPPA
jgi:hypothetical protein